MFNTVNKSLSALVLALHGTAFLQPNPTVPQPRLPSIHKAASPQTISVAEGQFTWRQRSFVQSECSTQVFR